MKKIGLIFLMALLVVITAGAVEKGETPEKNENGKNSEEIVSQTKEWRETLLYGIDTEVVSLIDKLRADKDARLAEDILKLFEETSSTKIIESSLKYFSEIEYSEAVSAVKKIVEDYEKYPNQVVMLVVQFLSQQEADGLADLVFPLVKHENKAIASAAIKAIGKTGRKSDAKKLLEYFEDEDFESSLKADIILAFGELKADVAEEKLIEVLSDSDSEASWRRYACVALGKIGDDDSFDTVRTAYAEGDTLLRSYAVTGISSFQNDKVVPFLMDALRDSYWKVRVSAAQGLAERKAEDAVPILVYKAKHDPEKVVRTEAMNALSAIGGGTALEYLRSTFSDKKENLTYRETALKLLAENHLDSALGDIGSVLNSEYEKTDSKLLDMIGKYVSRENNRKLQPFFEKFLDHPSFTMKIYGIRGIEKNGLKALKSRVEELTTEENNPAVRKAALAALDTLSK